MEQPPLDLATQFPSIDVVYPIAIASYDTYLKRIDALENRIQSSMAFAATVTLAFPAIAAGRGASFQSKLFIVALCIFGVASILCVRARVKGNIRVLSIPNIQEEYLRLPEIEFKKLAIDNAVEASKHNNQLIATRHKLFVWAIFFYLLEVVVLAVWVLAKI